MTEEWTPPPDIVQALSCAPHTDRVLSPHTKNFLASDLRVYLYSTTNITLGIPSTHSSIVNVAKYFPNEFNLQLAKSSILYAAGMANYDTDLLPSLLTWRKKLASADIANQLNDLYVGIAPADIWPVADVLYLLCSKFQTIPPLDPEIVKALSAHKMMSMTGWQFLLHILVPILRSLYGIAPPAQPFGFNRLAMTQEERAKRQTQQEIEQWQKAGALAQALGDERVYPGGALGEAKQAWDQARAPGGDSQPLYRFQAPPSPEWQPPNQPWNPQLLEDLQRAPGVQVYRGWNTAPPEGSASAPTEENQEVVKGLDEESPPPPIDIYARDREERKYFYNPMPDSARRKAEDASSSEASSKRARTKLQKRYRSKRN